MLHNSASSSVLRLQSKLCSPVFKRLLLRLLTQKLQLKYQISFPGKQCQVIIAKHREGLFLQRNLGTLLCLRIKGVVLVAYCSHPHFRPKHQLFQFAGKICPLHHCVFLQFLLLFQLCVQAPFLVWHIVLAGGLWCSHSGIQSQPEKQLINPTTEQMEGMKAIKSLL